MVHHYIRTADGKPKDCRCYLETHNSGAQGALVCLVLGERYALTGVAGRSAKGAVVYKAEDLYRDHEVVAVTLSTSGEVASHAGVSAASPEPGWCQGPHVPGRGALDAGLHGIAMQPGERV